MWCFSFVVSFVISVTFRALAPNGVLLFATNDLQNPTHFISLELVNGRLVFKYNAGYKTVRVTTTLRSYADDGLEYTVNTLIHSCFLSLPLLGRMGGSVTSHPSPSRAGEGWGLDLQYFKNFILLFKRELSYNDVLSSSTG